MASTTTNSNTNTNHPHPPHTHTHHQKDNMSIGSAESLAPRWVSPTHNTNSHSNNHSNTSTDGLQQPGSSAPSSPTTMSNKPYSHIHWVGIVCDGVMLCEYCNEPTNHKVLQMSRRFLKKNTSSSGGGGGGGGNANEGTSMSSTTASSTPPPPPQKVDWEFKTYAIQSQRRMVHAIQFHLYDMIPMIPGTRAKLQHLQSHTFLNGETVRIIEYNSNTQKYLIRPSIPLPEAQKLATTGMLVVHAKHLVPLNPPNPCYTTYTIAALYDGKQLTQNLACQFLEKILILSENFRTPAGGGASANAAGGASTTTTNTTAAPTTSTSPPVEMSLQTSFGPILKSQMELFHLDIENAMQNNTLSIENSLEYSKQIIERNMDIVAQLSNLHAV